MKRINFFTLALLLLCLAACQSTENVVYFQNLQDGTTVQTAKEQIITIQPDDKLTIFVKSRDYQLSQMFNLVMGSSSGGGDYGGSYSRYYIVDSKGCIDFPVLGKIQVAGKSREEVAEYIKNELVAQDQVKDPLVIVDFNEVYYNVMGEVNSPGRYAITKDYINILEALASAGDLTIDGNRSNVMVMRKEGDAMKSYRLDLTHTRHTLESPAYQIRQDDIIYVEPNKKRQRDTTVNGNNVLSASFWISIVSLAASLITMFKIIK